MIFVSLGTQDKAFVRILDILENADIDEEIIVQAGFTKYQSNKLKIYEYLEVDKMNQLISEARIIICHGGVGTIMKALDASKVVIACPRLAKYGEHQNDHQLQIVNNFSKNGYLLALNDGDDIHELLKRADSFKPKKIEFNNDNFCDKLENYLKTI